MRDILLLSHANPEDNEFTLWVALQLAGESVQSNSSTSYQKHPTPKQDPFESSVPRTFPETMACLILFSHCRLIRCLTEKSISNLVDLMKKVSIKGGLRAFILSCKNWRRIECKRARHLRQMQSAHGGENNLAPKPESGANLKTSYQLVCRVSST